MFGIGTGEILLILLIATLVVGPEEVVSFARDMGQVFARLRRETDSVTKEFREVLSEGPEAAQATGEVETKSAIATSETVEDAETTVVTEEEVAPPKGKTVETVENQEEKIEELSPSITRVFIDGETDAFASFEEMSDGAEEEPVLIVVGESVPNDEDVEPIVIEEPVLIEDDAEAGEG